MPELERVKRIQDAISNCGEKAFIIRDGEIIEEIAACIFPESSPEGAFAKPGFLESERFRMYCPPVQTDLRRGDFIKTEAQLGRIYFVRHMRVCRHRGESVYLWAELDYGSEEEA
ncbi:MAG: hypothetical protein LBC56_08525 [Oscillospiraceae bacterium]|jgi:hypothetical protein|nr:hypothetical protein [Oscillospiraceae bacterium]